MTNVFVNTSETGEMNIYSKETLLRRMTGSTWNVRLQDNDHLHHEGCTPAEALDIIERSDGWGVWSVTEEPKGNPFEFLGIVFEPRTYTLTLNYVL